MSTLADRLLARAYDHLDLADAAPDARYSRVSDIVDRLNEINDKEEIPNSTTGAISESLCQLGLKAADGCRFDRLPRDWQWLGDYSVLGTPFNVLISVKSFTARERLMASGSGAILAPTIGWGLFNDADEWNPTRTSMYTYRGFLAIYMPAQTLTKIDDECRELSNRNGGQLLRTLQRFPLDLESAIHEERIDARLV